MSEPTDATAILSDLLSACEALLRRLEVTQALYNDEAEGDERLPDGVSAMVIADAEHAIARAKGAPDLIEGVVSQATLQAIVEGAYRQHLRYRTALRAARDYLAEEADAGEPSAELLVLLDCIEEVLSASASATPPTSSDVEEAERDARERMGMVERAALYEREYAHVPATPVDDEHIPTLRFQFVNLRIRLESLSRFVGTQAPPVLVSTAVGLLRERLDVIEATTAQASSSSTEGSPDA